MLLMVDDVCEENIGNLKYLDEMHQAFPTMKAVLFTIAKHKNMRPITECKAFVEYFNKNRLWTLIGVHGYDHMAPPEQERDNAEELVKLSIKILKPYLHLGPIYRPPGFQTTIHTEKMLKKLGFGGIANQDNIKWLDGGGYTEGFVNCHLTENKFINPIGRWREWIRA